MAIALGINLFLFNRKIEGVEFPIFLMAIALTVWYAGTIPAILALILSTLAFNYYFTPPYRAFYIGWADVPYYVVFVLFALLITWFSGLRRRAERELLRSRDELQKEVATRTQQASLLDSRSRSHFCPEYGRCDHLLEPRRARWSLVPSVTSPSAREPSRSSEVFSKRLRTP